MAFVLRESEYLFPIAIQLWFVIYLNSCHIVVINSMRRPLFLVVYAVLGQVLVNVHYITRQWFTYSDFYSTMRMSADDDALVGMNSAYSFPEVHRCNRTIYHLRGEGRSLLESHLQVSTLAEYLNTCVSFEGKALTNLVGTAGVGIVVDNPSFGGAIVASNKKRHGLWGQ
jgi:hypothetical protein